MAKGRSALLLLVAAALTANAQIIFDTDSGYFGDDGVALVMLMRSSRKPEVRLISVVAGNVWTRSGANYMRRNLRWLRATQVPVRVGAQQPLVHTAAMMKLEGAIEFAGAFSEKPEVAVVPSDAVEAMARIIDTAKGSVTLLAIGPMTNVAMLLGTRPDLEKKIGALIFMGGNVHVGGNSSKAAEFNFWFDPEAAGIVLRSAIPRKVMFGLDVSNRVKLTKATFDEVMTVQNPITALYRDDFGNRYPGFLKDPKAEGSLWDELAAAYLIDPSLVKKSETEYLDVECVFGPKYGAVKKLDRKMAPDATPVEIVLDMDFPRVLDIYKKALMFQPPPD